MQPCELGIGFEGFQPCHSPVHVLAIYCVDTCHSLALTGVQQDTITHSVHVIRGDKSIALQTIGDTIDGIGAKRHGIVLYRKAGVSQRQVRDYIKKEGELTRRVQIKFKQTGGSVTARTELPSRVN
jgi:hypothetical protein